MRQKRPGVRFELTEQTRQAVDDYLEATGMEEKLVALSERGNIRPVSGDLFLASRHVASNGG